MNKVHTYPYYITYMKSDHKIQLALLFILFASLLWWELAGNIYTTFGDRWGHPSVILGQIVLWFSSGTIFPHIISTVVIAIMGLLMGAIIGVSIAFLFYQVPALDSSLSPIMAWLNSLPRVLLVPIFIAVFGIGVLSKVLMVIAITVFLFFFNVINGLHSISGRVIQNAKLLGANRNQLTWHVYLPYIGNWIMAILRPALGFAFIGAVISEYMGSARGLGYVVSTAYGTNNFDQAIAGLIIIFFVVGMFDYLLRLTESYWFRDTSNNQRISL